MSEDREERVRGEAYRRWEAEGRPDGQHDRHWREAVEAMSGGDGGASIESEGAAQAVEVPKPRAAAKPKAEKPKAEKTAKPVEAAKEKAPKVAAADASAGLASEPVKRARAKKADASK